MRDTSIYFELTAVVVLIALGIAVLSLGLPGWGLITIGGLLAMLSFALRKTAPAAKLATVPVKVKD
ncbi:hypothetical protein GCM10023116_32600 [Kistimonas scapharcae]|uniref:Uncharacterized protein n=1 Tax=Kistimonas scapharcae TaxID=1036133 RepID=A0ABP8V5A6_9GAMM